MVIIGVDSTKYGHFNATQLAHKSFPAVFLHLIPPMSLPPHLFSILKNEVVSQEGSHHSLNVASSNLSLSNTHSFFLPVLLVFLSYPPFYSVYSPLFSSQEVDAPDRC